MCSTPSRFSEASQAQLHVAGAAVDAALGRIVFVAHDPRTSSPGRRRSRRPAIARPTSSSLRPKPYMSAVSRNVRSSSSARWIVRDRFRIVGRPVELRHSHATETELTDERTAAAEPTLFHAGFDRRQCAHRFRTRASLSNRPSIARSCCSSSRRHSSRPCTSSSVAARRWRTVTLAAVDVRA